MKLFSAATTAKPARIGLLAALIGVAAAAWMLPARAQERPSAVGAEHGARTSPVEPSGNPEAKKEAAEDKVGIELPSWITGALKQWWYHGPATVSADGASVPAAQLVGKEVEIDWEDEEAHISPKPHYQVKAKIVKVGESKGGGEALTAQVDGQPVQLYGPKVTFALAQAFPEGIVISILTAIGIALVAGLLAHNLHRIPSKSQVLVEMIYETLDTHIADMIPGSGYKKYVPLIGTLFLYILIMNLVGLIPGWRSPTTNINVTAALAIIIVVYVQIEGIRANGFIGYLKHFVGEPWWLGPLNVPIHVIGEFARVLSLAVRLFGNIFGEDVVLVILTLLGVKFMLRGFIPVTLPMYFLAIFTSIVQAGVFSILSAVYIALMTTHEDHGGHHDDHGHGHDEAGEHRHDMAMPAPAV